MRYFVPRTRRLPSAAALTLSLAGLLIAVGCEREPVEPPDQGETTPTVSTTEPTPAMAPEATPLVKPIAVPEVPSTPTEAIATLPDEEPATPTESTTPTAPTSPPVEMEGVPTTSPAAAGPGTPME